MQQSIVRDVNPIWFINQNAAIQRAVWCALSKQDKLILWADLSRSERARLLAALRADTQPERMTIHVE